MHGREGFTPPLAAPKLMGTSRLSPDLPTGFTCHRIYWKRDRANLVHRFRSNLHECKSPPNTENFMVLGGYLFIMILQLNINISCFAQVNTPAAARAGTLDEVSSPLEILRDSGSALLLKNVSDKGVLRWTEVCRVAQHRSFTVVASFPILKERAVEPGETTVDSLGIDATPLVSCQKKGGTLAISEVRFADASIWKAKWSSKRVR